MIPWDFAFLAFLVWVRECFAFILRWLLDLTFSLLYKECFLHTRTVYLVLLRFPPQIIIQPSSVLFFFSQRRISLSVKLLTNCSLVERLLSFSNAAQKDKCHSIASSQLLVKHILSGQIFGSGWVQSCTFQQTPSLVKIIAWSIFYLI